MQEAQKEAHLIPGAGTDRENPEESLAENSQESHPEDPEVSDDSENDDEVDDLEESTSEDDSIPSYLLLNEEDSPDGRDPRARVLTVLELEDLFLRAAPDLQST